MLSSVIYTWFKYILFSSQCYLLLIFYSKMYYFISALCLTHIQEISLNNEHCVRVCISGMEV